MMRRSEAAIVIVFFFQAEDGIRDIGVTGVQTCALPISCTGRSTRAPAGQQQRGAMYMELLAFIPPLLALLQGSSQLYLVGFGFAAGTAVIRAGVGVGCLVGETIVLIHPPPEGVRLSRAGVF